MKSSNVQSVVVLYDAHCSESLFLGGGEQGGGGCFSSYFFFTIGTHTMVRISALEGIFYKNFFFCVTYYSSVLFFLVPLAVVIYIMMRIRLLTTLGWASLRPLVD